MFYRFVCDNQRWRALSVISRYCTPPLNGVSGLLSCLGAGASSILLNARTGPICIWSIARHTPGDQKCHTGSSQWNPSVLQTVHYHLDFRETRVQWVVVTRREGEPTNPALNWHTPEDGPSIGPVVLIDGPRTPCRVCTSVDCRWFKLPLPAQIPGVPAPRSPQLSFLCTNLNPNPGQPCHTNSYYSK